MSISLISIVDENFGIGYNNQLLTHMPADLKRFRELTLHKNCIMGRHTYESIIDITGKPLDKRYSIVMSKSDGNDFLVDTSCSTSTKSILETIELMAFINNQSVVINGHEQEFMVTGGQQVYNQFIHYAKYIYLTFIHHRFDKVDTYFPKFNMANWTIVDAEHYNSDDKNPYDYSFVTYKRKGYGGV